MLSTRPMLLKFCLFSFLSRNTLSQKHDVGILFGIFLLALSKEIYILTRVWVNTTSALSSSHKYCQASIEVWGHVKKCQHCMQTSASFSQRFILVAKARFLSTTCDSSLLLSSRKVLVLENSQEPIYKSLSSDHNSLSLDHKSLYSLTASHL